MHSCQRLVIFTETSAIFFINKAKALVRNVSYIFQDFSFFLRGAKNMIKIQEKQKL